MDRKADLMALPRAEVSMLAPEIVRQIRDLAGLQWASCSRGWIGIGRWYDTRDRRLLGGLAKERQMAEPVVITIDTQQGDAGATFGEPKGRDKGTMLNLEIDLFEVPRNLWKVFEADVLSGTGKLVVSLEFKNKKKLHATGVFANKLDPMTSRVTLLASRAGWGCCYMPPSRRTG